MTHQDTRSLEDKLAERLYNIDRGFFTIETPTGPPDIRPWQSIGYDLRSRYLRLAQECLRQMNWTHEHCAEMEAHDTPLTLAPPDWTP